MNSVETTTNTLQEPLMPIDFNRKLEESVRKTQNASKLSKEEMREVIEHELTQQEPKNNATVKLIGLQLKTIPAEDIILLENVERLSLRKNIISYLPHNFQDLKNLRYLDLHGNCLREIPIELMQCAKLEILDISQNKITQLPEEFSPVISNKLKVLSLKNNRISSIWALSSIIQFTALKVLEIEGNPIPKEDLDQVQAYTPNQLNLPKDEYWAIAIPRYISNHPRTKVSASQESKVSRAAKRMGFVSTFGDENVPTPMPVPTPFSETSSNKTNKENAEKLMASNNGMMTSSDLYNHTKYNDYFKRLSILPEESNQEQHKVSHNDLVIACRKLLFSFTECQQAIRKITSLCKEKSIAVNVVSLLYSVRSHIDNLVEILEQSEENEVSNDQPLIKLCITIISIFKQIIALLQKNFKSFFEEDDLCFIRMFYMSLICSYTEMYNAWSFITPQEILLQKRSTLTSGKNQLESDIYPKVSRSKSDNNSRTENNLQLSRKPTIGATSKVEKHLAQKIPEEMHKTNLVHDNETVSELASEFVPKQLQRSRSNTLQNRSMSSHLHLNQTPPIMNSPNAVRELRSQSTTSNQSVHSNTSVVTPSSSEIYQDNQKISHTANKSVELRLPYAKDAQEERRSVNLLQSSSSNTSTNIGQIPTGSSHSATHNHSGNLTNTAEVDIDQQLYETLSTVVKMVSVVYNQVTSEISKAALASTTGQQILTDTLASKIKDLTDTCRQLLQLSQCLSERLKLLTGDAAIAEKYLSNSEKLKTWESINAFLKAIISILANAKILMADLPSLNEVRPQLASLAKITKDVTVILDLSSYKAVSVTAIGNSEAQNSNQSETTSEFKQDDKSDGNPMQIAAEISSVPLFTPQPSTAYMRNPFEQQISSQQSQQ
ncbi:Leucine-rich repeat-containing protein SOG2 [Nakaseomyces bracarensis]|uniref:Leucine-rich repeat-containing protein SOG2 n=1 Tax=Nakaseomyces bracarensis TaxID=273131 RepID=A0ABR4NW04_9SACH